MKNDKGVHLLFDLEDWQSDPEAGDGKSKHYATRAQVPISRPPFFVLIQCPISFTDTHSISTIALYNTQLVATLPSHPASSPVLN